MLAETKRVIEKAFLLPTFILEMRFRNTFQVLFFCLCGLLSEPLTAQDSCVYLFTIPQQADFATADHLNNTYLLHGFEVEKYDSTGRFISRYSNNRLGAPKLLDASNPLKILVWYADFQTVVFLDRSMTELGRLALGEVGWPSIAMVGSATDGNLWAYDQASFKLLKMSTSGEKLIESEPLNLIDLDWNAGTPIFIKENGESVFLGVENLGVHKFDIYGHYMDIFEAFQFFAQFEVIGNLCISTNGLKHIGRISVFNMVDKTDYAFNAFFLMDKAFWLSKRRIFLQTSKGVAVYCF